MRSGRLFRNDDEAGEFERLDQLLGFMLQCHGIGPTKAQRYGDALLTAFSEALES